MSFKKILTATDFSARSQRAVDRAAHLARQFGAELRIVHAVPDASLVKRLLRRDEATQAVISRGAERAIEAVCNRVERGFSISPSWAILYGRASRAILDAQAAFAPDLLVIGTRGEGEFTLQGPLGGTTLKLLAGCTAALLLVRRPVDDHYRQLLVAIDNSAISGRVLAAARPWIVSAECRVVNAFEAPFAARLKSLEVANSAIDAYALEEQAAQARILDDSIAAAGLRDRVEPRVLRGDAATVLLNEIARIEPDLVIMGKHGSGFVDPASGFGSTVLRITFGSQCDLLQVA